MKVLVTGASRGIGKAIAEIFAANGHDLFISSRNEVALYKAMEELQAKYSSASMKAKAFDLSIKAQAKELGNWCLKYAVPDILVNNAGLFEPGSVHNEPEGALESQLATNVHSAYHLTRTLLPAMMMRKSGHIFNMCSIASIKAYPNGGSYAISKFALLGFSKCLREELKEFGIRVTAVIAGATKTASWEGTSLPDERFMKVEDIADAIYATYTLSDRSVIEEIIIRPQLGDI